MLRDDSNNGAGRRRVARNVLGEPLEICSIKPMTGFYRDRCCNPGLEDVASLRFANASFNSIRS